MTFGVTESATPNNARIPSIVILGADALVAALPAAPIQLAHACMLAGYQNVIPASWGDELIASASLRALRDHGQLPAIQCSCPHVAHRLLAVGTDLRPFLVSLVAPPVVLARYLRAVHKQSKLRITYVGRCPGAADESIDARLTPEELLARFADRQIELDAQPDAFDSVIPPDRRRFRSQPGGLPTADMLWSANANGSTPRSLVELYGDELPVELAQHLLAGKPVLIDVAPKLGCVGSGAAADVDPSHARARIASLEPPRAPSPVLDETIAIDASLPLPASPRSAIDVVAPPSAPLGEVAPNDFGRERGAYDVSAPQGGDVEMPGAAHGTPMGRRHSPTRGVARLLSSGVPVARDADGRQLPRMYVAHRRAPSRTRTTPTAPIQAIPADAAHSETSTSGEGGTATPHGDRQGSPPTMVDSYTEELQDQDIADALSGAASASPTITSVGVEAGEGVEGTLPRRGPAPRVEAETQEAPSRYSERAVNLPVTPLSDARLREQSPHPSGDRPVMQLLTLGLLIAVIVLVSAAVGVLVGRWMTTR